MLSKIKNRKEEGFTIIEVLIVLAIAGLIMLIVFLAVPALQRTQRNTARKNDVSRVGGAVTEFYSNNSGKTPASGDKDALVASIGTLNQYDAAGISIQTSGGGDVAANTAKDTMIIVTSARCAATGGGSSAGSSRQSVILYNVEASGGNVTPVCTEI